MKFYTVKYLTPQGIERETTVAAPCKEKVHEAFDEYMAENKKTYDVFAGIEISVIHREKDNTAHEERIKARRAKGLVRAEIYKKKREAKKAKDKKWEERKAKKDEAKS